MRGVTSELTAFRRARLLTLFKIVPTVNSGADFGFMIGPLVFGD